MMMRRRRKGDFVEKAKKTKQYYNER